MKDEERGPGWQSCHLQIEQGAHMNFAILKGSSGSTGLGLPQALALQTHGLAVLKVLLIGMSPITAPGKPMRLTLPVEPITSEWLGYRLGQTAEVFSW